MGGGATAASAIDIVSPTGNSANICAENPASGPVTDPGVCRTDNATWSYYMDSAGTFELEAEDRTAASKAWRRGIQPQM